MPSLPAVRPQPARRRRRGGGRGPGGPGPRRRAAARRDAAVRRSRTRTRRRTGRGASRCGGRTCSARRPRATSTSCGTCSARTTTCAPSRPRRTGGRATSPGADGDPPEGKLDLLLSLDFRMTSSTLLSDVVLPGRHLVREARPDHHRHAPVRARVQPGDRPAVGDPHRLRRLPRHRPPVQRARRAPTSGVRRDVVAVPLQHDTPGETAQPGGDVRDWRAGEVEPVPGRTMPKFVVVERDYAAVADKMAALGPLVDRLGMTHQGRHLPPGRGGRLPGGEATASMLGGAGDGRPAIDTDAKMAEAILALSATTNGRLAVQGFRELERRTGTAAGRSRRGQRGAPDHVRRHPGPAGAGDHQPGVVGQRDRRAPLRAVHRQRRAAQAVAHADRADALLARPRLDARARRDAAGLPRRRWTCTGCSARPRRLGRRRGAR